MKTLYVNKIKEGTDINGEVFAVRTIKKSVTKDGKPYLDVEFIDKTGSIKGKVWSECIGTCDEVKPGDIVSIYGKTGSFKDQPQVTVSAMNLTEDYCASDLMASTDHDIEEMASELKEYFKEIKNPYLKGLINNIFTDEYFEKYKFAPAATTIHHAYIGGILEHTLDILEMAKPIVKRYPKLNKDLLYVGIILHDIGKLQEYTFDTTITMTTEGKLLGHVYLGAEFVGQKAPKDMPQDLLDELKHLILSHQGTKEFGSPVVPKTPEAIALSELDDASFKINTVYHSVLKSESEELFTDFQRHLGTDLYKSPYREINDEVDEIPF